MSNWIGYLALTLLALGVQSLFALFEMASVSFHKIRLQYYVSIGSRRARWLQDLLNHPSRLFGTTILGINLALQIGSEASRRFYESIHLDPDWAPLTQVFLAVVLGELSPMFAARRHPEQIAMALSPSMVLISYLLTPFIWLFDLFSRFLHFLFGDVAAAPLYLSREEVCIAFEQSGQEENLFYKAISQMFRLKGLFAAQLATPLTEILLAPSHWTVADAKRLLVDRFVPLLPLYHKTPNNIVAVVHIRDLLNKSDETRLLDCSRPPWFIAKETSVLQILDQFRRNKQSLSVILNLSGQAIGILTLDQILDQILGEQRLGDGDSVKLYVERTLSADMTIEEFNKQFQASFFPGKEGTLEELILTHLGHAPVKGESIRLGEFIFTVLEPSLRGVKTVSVHSV